MRFGRKVKNKKRKVSTKTETWHVVPGEGRVGVRERVFFFEFLEDPCRHV